ncbi:MAG: TIGR02466 family protein [Pseudomonadota bacterium]
MALRTLFATRLYEADIGNDKLLAELAYSIRSLASDDEAGRRWSKTQRYPGYTSYASLNDLPRRDPSIAELGRLLTRQAVNFAEECAFDLPRKPRLDSLWVNLLKTGGHHSGHIHPHSIISGTFYVEAPDGSGAIRFEDPRLAAMMAAPPRAKDAPEDLQPFVTVKPRAGLLLLWESWLRHEVLAGRGAGERLSISFNFA